MMSKTLLLTARYIRAGEERFETLTLSASQTALLLVDVYYGDQRRGDWGDPTDPFVQHFERMEKNISLALGAARGAEVRVIYAMNSAPRIGLQRSAFGAHFARAWSQDGSPETFNREFAEGGVDPREYHSGPETPLKVPPSLAPREEDLYIRKHVYSAFFDSRLDTLLRNLGVRTLVMAGFWADVCMLATALDAFYRNYRVIWLRDGTLGGSQDKEPTTEWMIRWLEHAIGYTVTAEDLASACRAL